MGTMGILEGYPERGVGTASPGRSRAQEAWLVSGKLGRALWRGHLETPPSTAPTRPGGVGLKGEPGTFWHLRKLIPKDTRPWLCCPQEGSGYREWVSGDEQKPKAILEGQFLKGPIPRLGTWGRRATIGPSWRKSC